MLRFASLLSILAGGIGGCLIHQAVLSWEGANHPSPAKQREQDVLHDYAREMDAIFERHGRVMTPECEREQGELRSATQRKLADLHGGK
jgi:hypothetical protein